MNLSDQEIDEIISNNCGNPPQINLIEYHIWLNQSKLDFYTRNPFYKGQEHEDDIRSYRRLIKAGTDLLKSLEAFIHK